MDMESETCAGAGRRPLQHLQVAVGVAERIDGATADVALNADGFAFLVVYEIDLRHCCR